MGYNQYGIEIEINSTKLRYATDRMSVVQTSKCGESLVTFKPYITKFTPPKGQLKFGDKMPVTKMSVSVWDGYRELVDSFDNGEYGVANVTVFFFNDEGAVIGTQVGYMTDMSYSKSTASFTIRTDENKADASFLKQYSFDSFQYFEVLQIKNAQLTKVFTVNEQTPWRVFAAELPRTYLHNQYSTTLVVNGVTRTPWRPKGGQVWPGAPYIALTTKTNQYNALQIEAATFTGEAHEASTTELIIKEVLQTLFPTNPVPALGASPTYTEVYYTANLGNTEATTRTVDGTPTIAPRHEQIKYAYCSSTLVYDPLSATMVSAPGTGDGRFWLSGIPSGATDATHDPIQFYGSSPEKTALFDDYGVKNFHQHKPVQEIIAPAGKLDSLWVKANGLAPTSINDVDLGVGYLWAGKTHKTPIRGEEVKTMHRYVMTNLPTTGEDVGPPYVPVSMTTHYLADVYDSDRGDLKHTVLRLELHNRWLDSAHDYAIPPSGGSAYDISKKVDNDSEIQLVSFDYLVEHIDVLVSGTDAEAFELMKANPDLVKDRYRGLRVDMFRDFSDFAEELSTNQASDGSRESIKTTNNNLLNNAAGQFAICTGSEFMLDELGGYVERLYFKVNEQTQGEIGSIPAETEEPTEGSPYSNETSSSDALFMNNLKIHHGAGEASDWANNYEFYHEFAEEYFLKQSFRIVHDPVPENSKDLGLFFPIVYGFVNKVPMIQAISKKTFGSDESTAGDDTYIFASHKCDVYKPSDILVWLFKKGNVAPDRPVSESDYSYLVADDLIETPFPNSKDGHFEIVPSIQEGVSHSMKSVGKIYYPYHKIITKKTLDGDTVYGIQLRGDEWDDRVDRYDKRFPIRNGVGSSTLYASYGGYKDQDGQLISHPLDVIEHFIRTYGRAPYSLEMIDLDNIEAIKAKTRKYQASVFINTDMDISEFIHNITKQFGLFPFLWDGKILFSNIDPDSVDHSKPISEGLNLLEGVKEVSKGYTSLYTEVVVNYRKNYVTNKFDKNVTLNATNNQYCATASQSRSGRKSFTVNADWIHDTSTAKDVALRYARLVSSRRRVYECEVRYIEGISFVPGDVVPLTDLESGIDNEPVVIESVQQFRTKVKLTLLRLS